MLEFDESTWSYIDTLLPQDENVKKYVLKDFIWFINLPRKERNIIEIINEYAQHLEKKANARFSVYSGEIESFRQIDIISIKENLLKKYK